MTCPRGHSAGGGASVSTLATMRCILINGRVGEVQSANSETSGIPMNLEHNAFHADGKRCVAIVHIPPPCQQQIPLIRPLAERSCIGRIANGTSYNDTEVQLQVGCQLARGCQLPMATMPQKFSSRPVVKLQDLEVPGGALWTRHTCQRFPQMSNSVH